MKKSQLNEERIEEILRKMPSIKDDRDPLSIYNQVSSSVNNKRKVMWILPSFATAAAMIIVFILLQPIMNDINNQATEESTDKSIANEQIQEATTGELRDSVSEAKKSGEVKSDEEASEKSIANETNIISPKIENSRFVVTEEQLNDKTLVTFAIPDKNMQNVIPISYLSDNTNRSSIELMESMKLQLPVDEWGLSEFALNDYSIIEVNDDNEVGKTIIVDIPQLDQVQDTGTSEETILSKSVSETFRWMGIESAKFMSEGQDVEFGHTDMGAVSEIKKVNKKAYLLYQANEQYPTFLTPTEESFSSLKEALISMTVVNKQYNLKPSIPEGVEIVAVESSGDGTHVNIEFSKTTALSDSEQYRIMIDAIMLTAREFDIQTVSFPGANISSIGNVELLAKNRVPVAPNLMDLDD
ncbi:GerMN domain-containing protein [Cytobacillus sp. IB215316]|uniref:GerMN domain-containing protein n=1 Tax=Cytobacillus sp. IB215316 TaxID=3097354 RepID=UPI002A0C4936|nr:GerMN domain-containing protein [Cytobacillus sp. IB215316]MDX8359785.1 GerMN domain-containing protein [Cytobacillus sp. IB215316]